MSRIDNHPVLTEEKFNEVVEFSFNGRKLSGYRGEMLSSALFANGIKEFSIHKKGNAPLGIFCANGQCSQCTVIVNGIPQKSCITPLFAGMNVRSLTHLPKLPEDDRKFVNVENKEINCEILIIGAGPSGLTAAIELAELGFSIVIVEDKNRLGGKLLLQTHKFFGSETDCYAGTRGYKIGEILEKKVETLKNIRVLTNASVVGIYNDQRAGVFIDNKNYQQIKFEGLVISAGARERSLVFPGNDLPGVYGAGAFQTLVNRDLIRASDRVFIVGSGNVGLIAGYHALQANIKVVGIIDILSKVNGYKVHADKIKRMGVLVELDTTILSVEGKGRVEKVTVARVDKNFNPILESAKTYAVDTVLIATGLTPVDEFFKQAEEFGFKVVKAGDADEIAEASSAMFGGRIAGLKMAKLMGKDITIDDSYFKKSEILKAKPGKVYPLGKVTLEEDFKPKFFCLEEIPCNPCTTVCPKKAITLTGKIGSIMDLPEFTGECISCGLCVAVCPGLAVTLVKKVDKAKARVILPYEYIPDFKVNDKIRVTDIEGNILQVAEVVKIKLNKKYQTYLITVEVDLKNGDLAAGIRVQDEKISKPLEQTDFEYLPDNGIVCRCERVTVKEIVDYIREYRVRDVNQLKQIRVGMGACGSKTCSVLLPRIFAQAGVDYWKEVSPGSIRPLTVEVPMGSIVNEDGIKK
jgi:NADPH-dependent 2,4-dienoyl-CoA reductase/sulfur reductase-like enzyme/Fe-S-cluster-containing hydrogenase component 2